MADFKIELLSQYWIGDKLDDGADYCSHGEVLLETGGMVLSDESNGDCTVASSALRLMKSAVYGYDGKNDLQIIPHCGYLKMFSSCPNYIMWDVEISGGEVILSNIESSKNKENGLQKIEGGLGVKYSHYAQQV